MKIDIEKTIARCEREVERLTRLKAELERLIVLSQQVRHLAVDLVGRTAHGGHYRKAILCSEMVRETLRLPRDFMTSRRRFERPVQGRHITIWLCVNAGGMELREIQDWLNSPRGIAAYAVRQVDARRSVDAKFKDMTDLLHDRALQIFR